MKSSYRTTALLLAWFNAITAIAGGLAVATTGLGLPLDWLKGSIFPNYVVPGLILLIIVGGSSLIAALSTSFSKKNWSLQATAAGVIMVGWIIGEIIIINQFNWLHALFLLTGAGLALVGWVTMKRIPSPKQAS